MQIMTNVLLNVFSLTCDKIITKNCGRNLLSVEILLYSFVLKLFFFGYFSGQQILSFIYMYSKYIIIYFNEFGFANFSLSPPPPPKKKISSCLLFLNVTGRISELKTKTGIAFCL